MLKLKEEIERIKKEQKAEGQEEDEEEWIPRQNMLTITPSKAAEYYL